MTPTPDKIKERARYYTLGRRAMIDHDLNCASHGPDGAMCQKIRGHKGNHGGVDARGNWIHWMGGDS